jgi:hypothetical protein
MEETKLPGLLLMILGGIYILGGLSNMGGGVFFVTQEALANGITMSVSGLLGLIAAGVMIYGGLKMRNGENYNLAMAASILAMLPCSVCCVLGLPLGIWSIVTLRKDEVRSSFR